MAQQENPVEEMTRLAIKIVVALYGVTPRTHVYKSWRSHVFRLDFSDGRESRVLKIAKAGNEGDVLREQQILPALSLRGFEVPRIEYTQKAADFGMPFTIMACVEGGGMDSVGGMLPAIARSVYEHLGHFLARLSVLDAQTIPGAMPSAQVNDMIVANRTEYREVLRLHPRCTPRLEELFEQGFDLQQEKTGFAHWDGPQVITDGVKTFTVIDWGIAGAGNRLFDLSMFLMWHGFSVEQMKGLPLYPDWRAALLHGYLGGRPLTEETRMHLHLLGMSFSLRQAMAMAQHKEPKVEEFLTFIEAEDAAFLSAS